MTQLPNIITLLRIAGSMGLLFCDVMGVAIWIIYGLCGISDIVDGWLARSTVALVPERSRRQECNDYDSVQSGQALFRNDLLIFRGEWLLFPKSFVFLQS